MIINNVELEDLDLLDADCADRYEEAIEKIKVLANKENYSGLPLGDAIREQCKVVFDFVNTLWGEGTDKKLFGNKTNIRVCTEVLDNIIKEINNQKEEIESFKRKYSANRAERRDNKQYNKQYNKRRY